MTTVQPTDRPTLEEWCKQYKVGSRAERRFDLLDLPTVREMDTNPKQPQPCTTTN